jgi:hypothetical protein
MTREGNHRLFIERLAVKRRVVPGVLGAWRSRALFHRLRWRPGAMGLVERLLRRLKAADELRGQALVWRAQWSSSHGTGAETQLMRAPGTFVVRETHMVVRVSAPAVASMPVVPGTREGIRAGGHESGGVIRETRSLERTGAPAPSLPLRLASLPSQLSSLPTLRSSGRQSGVVNRAVLSGVSGAARFVATRAVPERGLTSTSRFTTHVLVRYGATPGTHLSATGFVAPSRAPSPSPSPLTTTTTTGTTPRVLERDVLHEHHVVSEERASRAAVHHETVLRQVQSFEGTVRAVLADELPVGAQALARAVELRSNGNAPTIDLPRVKHAPASISPASLEPVALQARQARSALPHLMLSTSTPLRHVQEVLPTARRATTSTMSFGLPLHVPASASTHVSHATAAVKSDSSAHQPADAFPSRATAIAAAHTQAVPVKTDPAPERFNFDRLVERLVARLEVEARRRGHNRWR